MLASSSSTMMSWAQACGCVKRPQDKARDGHDLVSGHRPGSAEIGQPVRDRGVTAIQLFRLSAFRRLQGLEPASRGGGTAFTEDRRQARAAVGASYGFPVTCRSGTPMTAGFATRAVTWHPTHIRMLDACGSRCLLQEPMKVSPVA